MKKEAGVILLALFCISFVFAASSSTRVEFNVVDSQAERVEDQKLGGEQVPTKVVSNSNKYSDGFLLSLVVLAGLIAVLYYLKHKKKLKASKKHLRTSTKNLTKSMRGKSKKSSKKKTRKKSKKKK